MVLKRWMTCLLLASFALACFSGNILSQELKKAPKPVYDLPDENFGVTPPPMDLSHLQPPPYLKGAMQPPSWDWRALGGVTSVKNQSPYGTCWAFASVGDLESKVLIAESFAPDYSELNAVACNAHGTDCSSGGWGGYIINYWSVLGSVDETCDPYPGGCPTPTCINPACPFYKTVTGWREIANDVTAIKNAVMTYGPVWTCLYASFPGFGSYDGSYCATYSGTEEINHAVLIVGWDDAMCGGNGGWICKNSWGNGWGDNGYFYMEYGNARIGEFSSVISDYKDYDPNETVYYWDELGWMSMVGYGDGDDWGLVEIIPAAGGYLDAVDFWAVAAPTSYTIYVYDDFSGGTLSSLLAGPVAGSVQNAGYCSIPLASPLPVSTGDAIYLVIDFNTSPYAYPVPFDDTGPMETSKCFISDDGSTWEALDAGGYGYGDAGIRGRTTPPAEADDCSKEGDPAFYTAFEGGVHDVIAGETACWTLGPCNFGFTNPAGDCSEADTFCVYAYDVLGWSISGVPTLETCTTLDPGYLWWQDVCITVPCDAEVCDYDTLFAVMTYCDEELLCRHACTDCRDPNYYSGNPYYSVTAILLHVVESPPALYIIQDSLYLVEQGQTAAYVPFTICNGDACADPLAYGYAMVSTGHIGSGFPQGGTTSPIPGGDCDDVYGVVDAGDAEVCDLDTLTIIAWDAATGTVYDTCVQIVHVVEPVPVPLFTVPVAAVFVLAVILAAAVVMKRRATSRS